MTYKYVPALKGLNLILLIMTIVVFNLFYLLIRSLILETKCVFQHQDYIEHCVACSNKKMSTAHHTGVCLHPPLPSSPANHRTFSRTAGQSQAHYNMLKLTVGKCDVIQSAKYTMQNSSAYGWQCKSGFTKDRSQIKQI